MQRHEFACPCCGENDTDQEFIELLDKCRGEAGLPFRVNSGYRCVRRNELVGGSLNSAHCLGLAADLHAPTSMDKYKIVSTLLANGFNRIGIYSNFIHCDISRFHPQNVVWHGS